MEISAEKLKLYLDFLKWFFGTLTVAVITLIVDTGFKERTAAIQEMKAYDEYVDEIIQADNIEVRWKLAEYFSLVTPSEELRERWTVYKDSISGDYKRYKELNERKFELSQLKNEGDDSTSTTANAELNIVLYQLSKLNSSLSSGSLGTENALLYEEQGFHFLLERDVENAIRAFTNSEQAYPGFHNVYEIARILRENNSALLKAESVKWIEIYNTILNDLSWRMPDYYRIKLQEIVNEEGI